MQGKQARCARERGSLIFGILYLQCMLCKSRPLRLGNLTKSLSRIAKPLAAVVSILSAVRINSSMEVGGMGYGKGAGMGYGIKAQREKKAREMSRPCAVRAPQNLFW